MIESLGKWQATQVSHSLMNLPALAIISLVKGKAVIAYKSKYIHSTLPIAEILSGKNVRAWVSMDFT